ncbi:hypothetical protein IE53DRAFT_372397, partial [Violaceomyces palustris]
MTKPTAETEGPLAPVYFISHGGPPSLFEPGHPAHQKWIEIGSEMRQIPDLKGIVVVSAHWQADDLRRADGEGMEVYVNVDETNPIIYDFYNFPKHY